MLFVFLPYNIEMVYLISLSWVENVMPSPEHQKDTGTWNFSCVYRNSQIQSPNRNHPLSPQHWMREDTLSQEKEQRKSHVGTGKAHSFMKVYIYRGFSLALWKGPIRKKDCLHPDAKPRAFYSLYCFSREQKYFLETQVEKLSFYCNMKARFIFQAWD